MFNRKSKPPTAEEAKRMARLKEMPCVACRMGVKRQVTVTTVHHLLSGNTRKGHEFTIPLCEWHHVGKPMRDLYQKEMAILFGPSLALESKKFHETFGSDEALLYYTNALLEFTCNL